MEHNLKQFCLVGHIYIYITVQTFYLFILFIVCSFCMADEQDLQVLIYILCNLSLCICKLFIKKKQIGQLKKGLNPLSVMDLAFGSQYLSTAIKTGIITGVIALAVSIYI